MTNEGSKGEEDVEDIEHGDVADSPVGWSHQLLKKEAPYFTEADDKDEIAMCQVPQLALPTLINLSYI